MAFDELMLIKTDAGVITCKANEAIVAGAFVSAVSGTNDKVDSTGVNTFKWEDIIVEQADDASDDYVVIVGIAGTDAVSGGSFPVYTEGVFILRAGEGITAGEALQGAEDTDEFEVDGLDATYGEHRLGRALTGASAADAYVVALIRI